MLSDVRETFRTVNIFVNKEKCLFLYLWTCGYLSYTVGIKEGRAFPSEKQCLFQRYTITIFTVWLKLSYISLELSNKRRIFGTLKVVPMNIATRLFLPAQVSDTRYVIRQQLSFSFLEL